MKRMVSKKANNTPIPFGPLGAHFSIAKGLHNAVYRAEKYNCTALQLFTKSAHTWKERTLTHTEIDEFERAKATTGITLIASHTSYLINLASCNQNKHKRSLNALKQEMIRSSLLGIQYVVLHPGFCTGGELNEGLDRITFSINKVFSEIPKHKTRLLLETTAGQGSAIGHDFKQLADIVAKVKAKGQIGICLDTCHIFAAGYDIRTKAMYEKTMDQFNSVIGMDYLSLIHLNDSKRPLGSKVDRHEHIGRGEIGMKAFRLLINDKRIRHIPKIIETPKDTDGKDWDEINLARLRGCLRRNGEPI